METEIKAYSYEALAELLKQLGQPSFRADQLANWLYAHSVTSYDEMENLPKTLRMTLCENHPLYTPTVINRQISKDKTRKYVLEFHDKTRVETVAMPSEKDSFGHQRMSVCVSTQVGCPMACSFCATGKEGFLRNLLPGEIIDQIKIVEEDTGIVATNIVTMGQGEPFLNYENVLAALRFANHPKLLGIGARHITLSTCGIIKGINHLSQEPEQFTLAVSLHCAIQKTRNKLMPKVANENLSTLKECLIAYVKRTNRRISFEYILLEGITDDEASLAALISYCKDLLCHVNLLPVNKVEGSLFSPSSTSTTKKWLSELEKAHIPVTLRKSRGSDISGACGQLKNSLNE